MGEEPERARRPPERVVPPPPSPGRLESMPELDGSICVGTEHACLVAEDGRVACVGANDHGQLGDGGQREQHAWVWATGLEGVARVVCGGDTTCAVGREGAVHCWGQNRNDAVVPGGGETLTEPTRIPGLSGATDVAFGEGACALLRGGRVRCWGGASGDQEVDFEHRETPTEPPGLPPAAQVGVGSGTAFARTTDGRVFGWGWSHRGELGMGEREGYVSPTAVPDLDEVVDLSVASGHACAVRRDGSLWCWGENRRGQLGNGDDGEAHRIPSAWSHGEGTELADVFSPVRIELPPVRRVATAGEHTCALLRRGGVACWGSNHGGALGTGLDAFLINRPAGVRGVDDAIRLATSYGATLAVRAGGALVGWGRNGHGQLARDPGSVRAPVTVLPTWNRPEAQTSEPITFAPIPRARRPEHPRLAARDHDLCAVDTRGRLFCFGELEGRACTTAGCDAGLVESLPDVVDVAFGLRHACAVRADGSVACWGEGRSGELGYDVSESAVPVPMRDVDDAVQVVAGWSFTCVLHESGEVSCLGSRNASIAGPEHEGVAREPVRIAGLSDVAQLAAGSRFVCARTNAGRVLCWGDGNSGMCGPDGRARQPTPVAIPGVEDAVDLATGQEVACAIRGEARTLTCWGYNDDGQVLGAEGDGGAPPSTPSYFRGVRRVALGEEHACALFDGDVVRCWGRDLMGTLGDGPGPEDEDGEYPRPRSPVRTASSEALGALGPREDLFCGGHYCCAHHARGGVSCWGDLPAIVPLEDGVLGTADEHAPAPMPLLSLR